MQKTLYLLALVGEFFTTSAAWEACRQVPRPIPRCPTPTHPLQGGEGGEEWILIYLFTYFLALPLGTWYLSSRVKPLP